MRPDAKKALQHPAKQYHGRFKYFHILVAIYIAVLITACIMGLTFISIDIPFTHLKFPAGTGTLIFPTLFIVDDIVTEVYGYAAARQMMWIGMAAFMFMFLGVMAAMHMPVYSKWATSGKDFDVVFGFLPRVVASFVVGIFAGAIVNDFAMAKIKIHFKGRFFMLRSLGSSMVGELALQITGATVGLIGRFDYVHEILPLILFAYCYKLVFDLFGMLAAYPIQKALKKAENIDHYDTYTKFNPFRFQIK